MNENMNVAEVAGKGGVDLKSYLLGAGSGIVGTILAYFAGKGVQKVFQKKNAAKAEEFIEEFDDIEETEVVEEKKTKK